MPLGRTFGIGGGFTKTLSSAREPAWRIRERACSPSELPPRTYAGLSSTFTLTTSREDDEGEEVASMLLYGQELGVVLARAGDQVGTTTFEPPLRLSHADSCEALEAPVDEFVAYDRGGSPWTARIAEQGSETVQVQVAGPSGAPGWSAVAGVLELGLYGVHSIVREADGDTWSVVSEESTPCTARVD